MVDQGEDGPQRGAESEPAHSAQKIPEEMVAGRASCPAGVGAQEVVLSLHNLCAGKTRSWVDVG